MPVVHLSTSGSLWFHCPGCGIHHSAVVDGSRGWTWDGSMEAPTISPSILVTGELGGEPLRCHSFVRAGKIEFLSDCLHALKGQTVALPEWRGFSWLPGGDPEANGARDV